MARPRRGVPATPPDIEGLAEKLAWVRDDAVAAADARVAGAETRLLSRLDEIAAGVA